MLDSETIAIANAEIPKLNRTFFFEFFTRSRTLATLYLFPLRSFGGSGQCLYRLRLGMSLD